MFQWQSWRQSGMGRQAWSMQPARAAGTSMGRSWLSRSPPSPTMSRWRSALQRAHACMQQCARSAATAAEFLLMPRRAETSRCCMWHPWSTGRRTWYSICLTVFSCIALSDACPLSIACPFSKRTGPISSMPFTLQVLVTVFSRPQLQAVLARMERRGKELGREPSLGASGRWAAVADMCTQHALHAAAC